MIRTFGQYSTSRDLYRRGFCTVSMTEVGEDNFWGAKPQVVKAIAWPELHVGRNRASDWVEEFVESAELQRSMAGEGAACWAPIHEVARTDRGGAYYVTDSFDASARLLAAGRYRWSLHTAEWLRGIVLGVLEGVEELQNRRGRAHGNLRAGNVLIGNLLDVGEVSVALVDPATSAQLVRSHHGEQEDMRDLGLVLHQMILHTVFRELGGWPLVDAEAWRAFGPELGERWRELVSWLIDPKAPEGARTIAECRKRVLALPKARAPMPAMKLARRAAMVAAGLAVVGAGGWQAYVFTRPFDAPTWQRYVNDYQVWASPLLDDARDPNNEAMNDPRLGSLRRLVVGGATVIDLDSVLGEKDASISPSWSETPPDAAKRKPVPYRTTRAVAKLDEIRALVGSEDWALRDALLRVGAEDGGTLIDGVGERWVGLAAYVRDIDSSLSSFKDELPIETALDVLDEVDQVDAVADSLDKLANRFELSGDRFLESFGLVVRSTLDEARDESKVDEFVTELRGDDGIPRDWVGEIVALDTTAKKIGVFLAGDWSRVDTDYFWSLPAYRDLADVEEADAEGLEDWYALATNPGYIKLDPAQDPRDGTLIDRMASLTDRAAALRESPALVQDLPDRLKLVEDSMLEPETIAQLAGDEAPVLGEVSSARTLSEHVAYTDGLYWVTEQQDTVEQWARATENVVDRLETEIASIGAKEHQIAQNYVKELREETSIARSPGVDREWLARRDVLLADYDTTGVLRSLVDRADAARSLLQRIDGALTAPDEVSAKAEPTRWDSDMLLSLVRSQREQQLESVVKAIDWSLSGEALSNSVDAGLAAQQRTYNAWQARVAELVADMARAESLMALDYLPEDKPSDGGQTLGAIFAFWSDDPVLKDVSGRDVFSSIFDLHSQLASLDSAESSTLTQLASNESTPPVVAFGAWRRLGEMGGAAQGATRWPNSVAQLETESALREHITEVINAVPDPSRAEAMRAELKDQGQQRWERVASRARNDADIDAVLTLEKRFGVDRTKLDPRTRYNTALAELRALAGDEYLEQDEVVEAGINEFIALARQSGSAYAGQAARMEGVLREAASKPETIDMTEYGPALDGWEVTELDRRMKRVTYASPNGVEVEFALVRPKGKKDIISRPFFITTDEVSMRVGRELMSTITGARADAEADSLRRELEEGFSIGATVGVNWEGPRSWQWSDLDLFRLGLLLNQSAGGDGWLWVNQFADQYPLISPEIAAGQSRPTYEHPLNHISPFAATKLAGLIDTELPTVEQWQAAYAYHEAAQGAEDRLWNLRDQTWKTQLTYATEVRRQLGSQATFFQLPDSGIFLPDSDQSIPTGENASVIDRSEPDGTLWFAFVDTQTDPDGTTTYEAPGAVLKHMLGNVAEIVRTDEGSGFAVIGGSAMSPPELPLTEPAVIHSGFNQLERSYSDVGFRLSFETADFREPMSVMLADALDGLSGDY